MRKLLMTAFGMLLMAVTVRTASAQLCTQIMQPGDASSTYRTTTNRCSLGTPGSTTSTCMTGATFTNPLSVRAIGMGWATCSSPPDSEVGSDTIVGFIQS